MKKRYLPLSILALSLAACSTDDLSELGNIGNLDNTAVNSTLKNATTTQEIEVPVQAGYITNVYYNGELIAKTNQADTKINVPSNAASAQKMMSTRADQNPLITFEYVKDNGTEVVLNKKLYLTLLFEDSRSGENDFNDLVTQVRIHQNNNKISFDVYPVAMGSSKDEIALGVVISDGKGNEVARKEIYSNIRQELFDMGPVEYVPAYKKTLISYEFGHGYAYITTTNDTIRPVDYRQEGNVYYPIIPEGHGDLIPILSDNSIQIMEFKSSPFVNTVAVDSIRKGETTPYNTYYRVDNMHLKSDVNAYVFEKAKRNINYHCTFYLVVDRKKDAKENEKETGKILYAVSSDEKLIAETGTENFLSTYGTPLGLVLADEKGKEINYPREGKNINDVYPSFNNWLNGSAQAIDFSQPAAFTYYDAIGKKLYRWPSGK